MLRSRVRAPARSWNADPEPAGASARRARLGVALVSLVSLGLGACRSAEPAQLEGRLWVDGIPTSARDPITAFVILDLRGHRRGLFVRGSAYRAGYDAFAWAPSEQGGNLTWLQDGRTFPIVVEPCAPDEGFDYCMLLRGDPTQVERYQSRKRWKLGVRTDPGELQWPTIAAELAASDPELAPLTGP